MIDDLRPSLNPLDSGDEFAIELMNPNPSSSKTKDGPKYRVSFEMTQDDWQCFMDANTSGMVLEMTGRATVIPVTQLDAAIKAAKPGAIIPVDKHMNPITPKGGPLSKAAAMLCQDDKANEYAGILGHKDFKELIYARCCIQSRAELDHDKEAAKEYESIKSQFIRWAF
jgi:hypothetical protein